MVKKSELRTMLTFKHYNIADWLSFYRIAVAPILLLFICLDHRQIFSWLLLFSYATDAVDGYIARKFKLSSSRGAQLDSLGDQVTFVVAIIGLYYFEKEFVHSNLLFIGIVFSPYLIQMLIAYFKYGKATAFHTYLAKASAILQSIFVLFALFFFPDYTLFYIMIVIGVVETIEEIILIFLYDQWTSDVKGIYWAVKDKRRIKSKP